jgi:hypothetical protein
MTRYQPLLWIRLCHGFYASEHCPSLRIVPTPATQAAIGRAGGLCRPTADGVVVMVDELAVAAATQGDGALAWLLVADDSAFDACTAGLGQPRRELMVFDATNAVVDDPTGAWRVHGQATAAVHDVSPVDDLPPDDVAAIHALRHAPFALVRVPLARLREPGRDAPRFLIRLAPRATLWAYCLVGDWSEPSLQVVDEASQVAFEQAPHRRLADGRDALVFRSTAPIALRQRPAERFQLRSRGEPALAAARPRADRIVIRRLPQAAPCQFTREVIAGAPALVSEIFVHR